MNKKQRAVVALAFLAGMVAGWMTVGMAGAWGAQDGPWSASEKRQVISLLENIESNTR